MAEEQTKILVPHWKQVMLRAYVVWVAVAATLAEVVMYVAQNMDSIQAYVPEKYKFWFRIVIGIAIIALRPIQQKSLAKLRDGDDGSQPLQKGVPQ